MLLIFEREAIFFDHGIGEHFARDPLNLGSGLILGDTAFQRNFEIFSLTHVVQALVTDFGERTVDRFTLRIKDALLQRDVNVGFHQPVDYTLGSPGSDRGFLYRRYFPAKVWQKVRFNLFEGRELPIQSGYRLQQHVAVAGVCSCLELLRKPLP
jgi:hypothetical protein